MNKREVMKAEFKAMAFFLVLGIILGICLTELYIQIEKQKELGKIRGLFFTGDYTKLEAEQHAKEYNEGYGEWVCSNTKGIDYQGCVEVAKHECAHEWLASEIENNPNAEKLLYEIDERIKNETK